MKNIKVSIIIRTKNEERWISRCLNAIKKQNNKDYEIILVDNKSDDKTVEKAKIHGVKKIVLIDDYLPGYALNKGIAESSGEFIVCLSAHCIPIEEDWLERLLNNFKNKDVAGTYGRQVPMEFSKDSDKRDLFLVFGLDKKIQVKDSFFHNANSMIRKEIWKKIKFDERISNIEDRIWGQKIIDAGYKLVYEPSAPVYHFHGIHQDGNVTRLKNVVNIIKKQDKNFIEGNIKPDDLDIYCIIPSKGMPIKNNNDYLIAYTINVAKKSKYIKDVIVSTDNDLTKKIAQDLGAKCPFARPQNLSDPNTNLEMVQKFSMNELEKLKIFPDLIVHLEETFPFRDTDLIDNAIEELLKHGYDTILAAREENGWLWKEDEKKNINRIDEGDVPRIIKKKTYIGLHGLCCITYPEYIREGNLLGKKVGLLRVDNHLSWLEIRSESTFKKYQNFFYDKQ
tara:strand:+ start:7774 stop:9126 length:1353 start_codon:yes stop_codon:yes gene_type:complete